MPPKVSVVVIAYNEEKTLPACLDSLLNLDYPKESLEIIVVDNGSTDKTATIVKRYPVHYAFESYQSRGKARNKGIEIAQGEFIAFLDADCVAHKNWIKNLSKKCTLFSVGGCGGEIYSYNPSTLWERYIENRGIFHQKHFIDEETLVPTLKTANALYPKSVLKSVDFFDEISHIAEDTDLSLKIVLSGFKIVYVPDAIVFHKHRNNLFGLWQQFFGYGRDNKILKEKYKKVIVLSFGPFFRDLFYIKKGLQDPNNQKEFLEILYFALDLVACLAYSMGWLTHTLFRRLSVKQLQQPNFISNKIFRELDGKIIISSLTRKCNYSLGDVGTKIYDSLILGKTRTEIIDKLYKEYEIDRDKLEKDFTEFINKIEAENLLEKEVSS